MDFIREIERIRTVRELTQSELEWMLELGEDHAEYLYRAAREVCDEVYGKKIYLRGLIEYTNYCKNNCFYCGIRAGHVGLSRYRMSDDRIMECVEKGYRLGARTIVIQGGESPMDGDDTIVKLVKRIREAHPDVVVTLCIGEKSRASYEKYYEAGAERYLLRHETANREHYRHLHPSAMKLEHRMQCLFDLKDIGFQVGCGMMIGSPGQTIGCLYEDLMFIRELQPHMVGIGPFIAQRDTPFSGENNGTADRTTRIMAIVRLLHPRVLMPATTALETVDPNGYEKGIRAGANVLMPDLTPPDVRKKYTIYDDKKGLTVDDEGEMERMKQRVLGLGYEIVTDRGDSLV